MRRSMNLFAQALLLLFLSFCGNVVCPIQQVVAGDSPHFDQVSPALAQGDQGAALLHDSPSSFINNTLTEEERAWLREHPVIRVVQDPGWPPIEFIDGKGEYIGITGDYLRLIEHRLGITFERVRDLSWQEAYARLKRWEIDMTTSVAVTPERTEFWAFTNPYMRIPIVIVAHSDVTYIGDMRELRGKKIAVVDGYAVNDWIPRDFPDIQLVRVKTAQEGLESLQREEVFAYIENMLVVGYYLAKLKMTNLKIAGETPYVNAQCMAVRRDWATLAGILQKALDSIPETERNEIYRKWLPIRYEHGFDYTLLWQALAICGAILLGLVVWIRRLFREIRYRKDAESALRESEQRFRQLFDLAGVPLCFVNKEGVLVDLNARFVQCFGYAHEDVPTLQDWRRLAYPDPSYRSWVVETWEAAMRRSVEEKTGIEPIELRVTCKNGDVRTVVVSGAMLGDDFLATFFDITERKQAEQALADEAVRRRILVEQSRDGIVVLDQDGKVYEANQRYAEMLGYTLEEVHQLHVWDWDTQWTREQLQEMVRSVDATGDHFETRHCRKDGTVFDVEVSTNGAVCSGKKLIFCVCRDITERKRAEEALRESEEHFRNTFEQAAVGMSILSSSGVWLQVNRRLCEILGYSHDELMKLSYRDITLPEYLDQDMERVRRMVAGTRSADSWEKRYIRKDGKVIWVRITTSLSRSEDGRPQYFVTVTEDITEQKRAEDERRRLEERLQRAEKMEALGTLAGGVAHDLNNVLGIVVGYSELLLNDLEGSSSTRSDAMEILRGGQRAAAIVQDLLTLARRGVPIRKALNLNNIVMEWMESPEFAKSISIHPGIEVKTDFEVDLLNVSGSSVHLGKSFINLVSNAAEAMPHGGTLTVTTANRYLDKPILGYDEVRTGDYVVLSVSDTGEGIAAPDLKRIFEPFYTKKVMGRSGTGLGLAVVWGTVKDHLGYINVESEEGIGTTFTIYFPVTREAISPEQVSISAAEYMGKGESILVVDDVKEQRELAKMMLKRLNYAAVSVSSGEEAVAYLKQERADLVVLDMIMDPGMDGLDTYLKILEIHPRQKAIIVSGFSETERVNRAQALGAGSYVRKPYVLEKLGLAVRKELDQSA